MSSLSASSIRFVSFLQKHRLVLSFTKQSRFSTLCAKGVKLLHPIEIREQNAWQEDEA
jgi:hypothetical protein